MCLKSSQYTQKHFLNGHPKSFDVVKCIENLEKKYRFDFIKLPQYKKLIESFVVANRTQGEEAGEQRANIVRKLLAEVFPPSPLLKGKVLQKSDPKKHSLLSNIISDLKIDDSLSSFNPSSEIKEATAGITEEFNVPLNSLVTENITGNEKSVKQRKSSLNVDTTIGEEIVPGDKISSNFPCQGSANPRKCVSVSSFQSSLLNDWNRDRVCLDTKIKVSVQRYANTLLISSPPVVIIKDRISKKTTEMFFTVLNHSSVNVKLKYAGLKDISFFNKVQFIPSITIRNLPPGMSIKCKLSFELVQLESSFETEIIFRVSRLPPRAKTEEIFCVPLTMDVTPEINIHVQKTVEIPPTYIWNFGKPVSAFGTLQIKGKSKCYHVHIRKEIHNANVTELNLNNMISRSDTNPVAVGSDIDLKQTKNSRNNTSYPDSNGVSPHKPYQLCRLLSKDLIDISMGAFIFEKYYIFLAANSKATVKVNFSNAERIGFHQCRYTVYFFDCETSELRCAERVTVLAEVLGHPLGLSPPLLDMRNSPVSHGVWTDLFTLTNAHAMHAAVVKVILPPSIKKLLAIKPVNCFVPARGGVVVQVSLCSPDLLRPDHSEDEVLYFTFELKVTGKLALYHNVPSLFYEVIAPCMDFRRHQILWLRVVRLPRVALSIALAVLLPLASGGDGGVGDGGDAPHSRQKRVLWITNDGRLALPPGTTMVITPSISMPLVRYPPHGFLSNMTVSFPFTIDFDKLGLTDNENPYGTLPPLLDRSLGRAAGSALADYLGRYLERRRGKRDVPPAPAPADDSGTQPDLERAFLDRLHGGERAILYGLAEDMLTNFGWAGRECLLRAICEVHAHPLANFGFLGEVLRLFFTPSKSPYAHLLTEYTSAQRAGEERGECFPYYKECPKSIFLPGTNKYSKEADDLHRKEHETETEEMNEIKAM